MIYLDNAATTKPYPEVVKAMNEAMSVYWANPSSNNSLADEVKFLIEGVRQQFADDLNCSPEEIIFTGSGCEANTLAIEGFLKSTYGYCLYCSNLEHTSINELIEKSTIDVHKTKIPNTSFGIIDSEALNQRILYKQEYYGERPFVVISAANSEIGAIQNIKELASVVHKRKGIIHCDAVQLFPERRIDVKDLGVDMLSISAQKFHGPRGIGVLYVRNGIKINPIIYGSQENYLRGGSYNTAAICGMGEALRLTREKNASNYIQNLRDNLLEKLLAIPGTYLNGPPIGDQRLVNNISLTIDGVSAEKLVTLCDLSSVIIAKGSACQSYIPTPSTSLLAIGLAPEKALKTVRITLDEFNTEEEINQAADIITALVDRIRSDS